MDSRLKIGFCNLNGFRGKRVGVKQFLAAEKCHVMACIDTKVDSIPIDDALFDMPRYNHYVLNGEDRTCGMVLYARRPETTITSVAKAPIFRGNRGYAQKVIVAGTIGGNPFTVVVVYVWKDVLLPEAVVDLTKYCREHLPGKAKDLILIGDFNAHWESSRALHPLVEYVEGIQTVNERTRDPGAILDCVVLGGNLHHESTRVLSKIANSDHYAVVTEIVLKQRTSYAATSATTTAPGWTGTETTGTAASTKVTGHEEIIDLDDSSGEEWGGADTLHSRALERLHCPKPSCDKTFTAAIDLNRHVASIHSSARMFKCDQCPREFPHQAALYQHSLVHLDVRPYGCPICPQRFISSDALARHANTHTGDKPFACDQCEASFPNQGNLARHQSVHTGVKPHQCRYCDKNFSDTGALKVHENTHTADRRFDCSVCSKQFTTKYSLDVHARLHSGNRPFQCRYCAEAFQTASNRGRHERIHTGEKPHQCDVCGREFVDSSALARHKRTHTGEKPYECDVCGKKFAQSNALTVHKRTHTGENPYECDVCGKKFAQSGALTVHKRTHPREQEKGCE